MTIEVLFSDPSVHPIVRAAFPGATSRRTVKVDVRKSYHVHDYWDGGSRDYCAFVDLASMRALPSSAIPEDARQVMGNPFGVPIAEITMRPGFAVVEHCIFRGKDLGFRVYLHESNVAPFLQAAPKAGVHVSERDRRILASIRSLKSGPYRKEALARLDTTEDDLNRLAGMGLLKRSANGATQITSSGRIACAGESRY